MGLGDDSKFNFWSIFYIMVVRELKGYYETPWGELIPIYWSYPEFITVKIG